MLAALKSEFNTNISGEIYEEDTKWACFWRQIFAKGTCQSPGNIEIRMSFLLRFAFNASIENF